MLAMSGLNLTKEVGEKQEAATCLATVSAG